MINNFRVRIRKSTSGLDNNDIFVSLRLVYPNKQLNSENIILEMTQIRGLPRRPSIDNVDQSYAVRIRCFDTYKESVEIPLVEADPFHLQYKRNDVHAMSRVYICCMGGVWNSIRVETSWVLCGGTVELYGENYIHMETLMRHARFSDLAASRFFFPHFQCILAPRHTPFSPSLAASRWNFLRFTPRPPCHAWRNLWTSPYA